MNSKLTPLLPVMISACLRLLLSFGYRAGFGLFMQPLSEAKSWVEMYFHSRSPFKTLAGVFWGVIAVFAGGLATLANQGTEP